MMIMYKQITILVVFGVLNLCIFNGALSGEENPDSSGIKGEEAGDMLETLKREREELEKLKSKFQETVRLKESAAEVQQEDDTESKSDVVLSNNADKNEKPADEQESLLSSGEEENVARLDTFDTKEEAVDAIDAIKKVISDGDEILHPFEIAESLYKLGEYQSALEIYELIDKNTIDKEREVWISYQIANCYRKLEIFDEAVKVYREMKDLFEGTYWARQAQWYIQNIEWNANVEERIEKVIER